MTLTVALDTATDVASIAVGRDRRVLVEVSLPGRRHAAALLAQARGAGFEGRPDPVAARPREALT